MSPVHLAVLGDDPSRIPVVGEPFWIGRDPGCDLCLWDLRISRKHAKVARTKGEYLISSEGKHGVYVNGTKVPVFHLRHGDEISLTPPGEPHPIRMRFENELEGVFVPPDGSISAAWAERVKLRDSEPTIVTRYETLGVLDSGAATPPRLVRERATGRDGLLSVFSPIPVGASADAWLRLVAAIAGVEHPHLARVVDGGIEAIEEGALRWIVTNLERGRTAAVRILEGPQSAMTVVRRLRGLAVGLHLLHSRGVVHGAVRPSHIVLKADGGAVLVGYGRTFLRRDGVLGTATGPADEIVPAEADYLAPEVRGPASRLASPAADVYGLCAVGLGMLRGRSPGLMPAAAPRDPGAAPAEPESPTATPLEEALLRGLHPVAAERPTAEELGQALAFVEASLSRPEGE